MDIRQQEQLKAMAEQQQVACEQATMSGALAGCSNAKLARSSLRDRITDQLYRAMDESRRSNQLQELQYLLDKNPEVARILDLLEFVKD